MIEKIKRPDKESREAMYYADRQDFVYRRGAYDYLESIAMVPRLAAIAGYIRTLAVSKALDVGCGTGGLLAYLDSDVAYTGVDISPTAIDQARERFSARRNVSFEAVDFRNWEPSPADFGTFDAVVWAGIGCAWTLKGRRGSASDWLDILAIIEQLLKPGGYLIFELVTDHWPALEGLMAGRYVYRAGCDLDCFQSEESPHRSIRVFQKKEESDVSILKSPGSSLIPQQLVQRLAALGEAMGQATDKQAGNLGFGYLYYGLTRLYRPETVVCIGSYRGFSPVCLALGLVDNQQGTCYFIDPGKVDGHWHDPDEVGRLSRRFGLQGRFKHFRQTSQAVLAAGGVPEPVDILLIDGDHSYAGVKFDFDHFGRLVRPGGLILFHDSVNVGRGFTKWEVKSFLEAEVSGRSQYEMLTFPFAAGLTLVRKLS